MSEKDRDEIAGMLTKKQIDDLGAPWLSLAQAPPQTQPYLPPLQPYVAPPPNIPADRNDSNSPLSLESYGAAAGPLNKKQIDKSGAVRLRYGRSY